MSENETLLAVRLARNAVESELLRSPLAYIEQLPAVFRQNGAVFVTIKSREDGALRGCIGSLIAYRSLYEDVVANAKASAFEDPRFPPMIKEELPFIRFELSILSQPKRIFYESSDDLLNNIYQNIDGLVIKYNSSQATFLPSVWLELPNKEEFLSRLCEKARLPRDFWRGGALEVYSYQAQKIDEP
jgi:AmmeMemoRadiSam system protein A